jgi:mannose-6-phosphate isomerase
MRRIALLENPIRDYAWGSRTAIAALRGEPGPSAGPQAELWIGAHPSAPSHVEVDGRRVSLADLVAKEPLAILGPSVIARFGPRLPFLAKLLAAEAPLSLQAHPDEAQARAGFERENALGIPLGSEKRCYRDSSHKPELLCALEPFEALCGFREPGAIREQVGRLGHPGLEELVSAEFARPEPLQALLGALLRLDPGRRIDFVAAAADAASGLADPALAWIPRLARLHPGDAGALAPLFLEYVRLEPGDALFLPAGELHGYLGGFAVEVMASSDNVLRGGLTSKHVDAEELLRILRGTPSESRALRAEPDATGALRYVTPAEEFELSRVRVGRGRAFTPARGRGVEILLCTRGQVRVIGEEEPIELRPGRSCLVPAAAGAYRAEGEGELYRVAVPGPR